METKKVSHNGTLGEAVSTLPIRNGNRCPFELDLARCNSDVSTLPIRNGNFKTIVINFTTMRDYVSTLPIRNGNLFCLICRSLIL